MTKTDPRPEYLHNCYTSPCQTAADCLHPLSWYFKPEDVQPHADRMAAARNFLQLQDYIGLCLESSKTNLYTRYRYRKENTFKCPFLKLFV